MVVGAHGLRGGLRLRAFSDHPAAWWHELKLVRVEAAGEIQPVEGDATIQAMQMSDKGPRMWLSQVRDRTQAEALRGASIMVPAEMLPRLAEEEFYMDDLAEALVDAVLVSDSGEQLGVVVQFWENPAHPLLEVRPEGVEETKLVPLVKEMFQEIFPSEGKLTLLDPAWFHAL